MVTEREMACLWFLDDKMEATAAMIGKAVYEQVNRRGGGGGSNLSAIGASVAGKLCKQGLVAFLPDLRAWRITAAGRDALNRPAHRPGRLMRGERSA